MSMNSTHVNKIDQGCEEDNDNQKKQKIKI